MTDDRTMNRKLLVSVFNPQEAREAVLGGGRIIDSEDPRSALGNIKPQQIMAVSDAVLGFRRDLEVQLSTNIGEDQLLYDRSGTGAAIQKSAYEIAGKASQAALGVAVSMGTRVHPCGIVKVGLDGMETGLLTDVLRECVQTLRRTEGFSHTQVMSVLFAQDLDLWEERRSVRAIRQALVGLREFHPCESDAEHGFDLTEYAAGTLRDEDGRLLFTDPGQVDLESLIDHGVLPEGTPHTTVALNELFPHARYGITTDPSARRTDREAIARMVDATVRAGAGAMMLDTSVLLKVARVGLVATERSPDMTDFNSLDVDETTGLKRRGILSLDDIRFFVDYCHHRGIEANLAGSVTSYQAQQLWRLVPEVDQISTRGAASAVAQNPHRPEGEGEDSRRDRVIVRSLVRGLVPPEQGGYLWLPQEMKPRSGEAVREVLHRFPGLTGHWADRYGRLTPFG
ncbi:(5-formylfuran-3-yl)methyl phosphate synthase [Streptomyces sp. NPDC001868]|uniref:(5-formylfuran-3-yl)methyl phosphate synthase n=1 Tax=Streptomyces sp. NPDC001868 TaxID=3154401 RepID=UPI0033226B49